MGQCGFLLERLKNVDLQTSNSQLVSSSLNSTGNSKCRWNTSCQISVILRQHELMTSGGSGSAGGHCGSLATHCRHGEEKPTMTRKKVHDLIFIEV